MHSNSRKDVTAPMIDTDNRTLPPQEVDEGNITSSLNHGGWRSRIPRNGWYAMVYVVAAAISLFLRLLYINFDDSKTPVFDEKHYAVQAQQMLHNGGLESNPGYGLIVHPPLGKWLISIGEWLFGYGAIGWRFSSVIAGVAIVLMVMRMVHLVTGNIVAVILSGVLVNFEGTQLFMSRIAMLDVFVALFVTAIAFCLVNDAYRKDKDAPFLRRWWLLASGFMCGFAMSVKISGVYYPALIGIVMVIGAAVSSRSVQHTMRALGSGLIFYFVIPMMVFIASWLPWFASENSVYRHIAEADKIEHPLPGWLAGILPDSVNSFFSYQLGALSFHSSLESGSGIDNFHPWESKPINWLMAGRPILFLSTENADNPLFSSDATGVEKMVLHGNIAVWALLIPVVAWGTYRIITSREHRLSWAIVVGGILVGILPWVAMWDRQQYFFYVVSWTMFLSMGVALALYEWAQIVSDTKGISLLSSQAYVMIPYLSVVVIVGILYSPWMYGLPISRDYNDALTLFDSWKEFKGYK